MAVESGIISVVYAITSAEAGQEFPIPFPYIEKENVIVYYAEDRALTNLTYGTDYTVSNTTLTVTGTLPVGAKLVIHRVTPMTQDIVWVDGQAVYTPDIMQADDKLTFIAQELREQIDRAIKVDASSPKTADELLDDIFDARDDAAESASDSSDYADASAASALLAQAWAESSTPPDSEDATSKSAKTWAGEAAQSASAAIAANNSVPNFTISTETPTENDGVNGDVWFTYTPAPEPEPEPEPSSD